MAYIYQHIRLDTEEVFYVGFGKHDNDNFKRAYSKSCRNRHWNGIANSVGYKVEIILTNLTIEEGLIKETELIKLYGREDLGLGTLVNLTDGGDGLVNPSKETLSRIHTPENTAKRLANIDRTWTRSPENIARLTSKENLDKTRTPEAIAKRLANTDYSNRSCNHMHTEEVRKKSVENTDYNNPDTVLKRVNSILKTRELKTLEDPNYYKSKVPNNKERLDGLRLEANRAQKKPILQYSLEGVFIAEWECAQDYCEAFDRDHSNIVKCLRGKQKSAYGFFWKYKNKIQQFDLEGNLLNEFYSTSEASKLTGISTESITRFLKGRTKTSYKYIWKYKNEQDA